MKHYAIISVDVEVDDCTFKQMEALAEDFMKRLEVIGVVFSHCDVSLVEVGECD